MKPKMYCGMGLRQHADYGSVDCAMDKIVWVNSSVGLKDKVRV